MADKIKGLSVKIGGDTSGLAAALKDINTRSKTLQTDLKTVDRLLKLDPSNTVLVAQKQDLLTKSIEATKDKLKELEKAEEAVQKGFEDGTINREEFLEFQKVLVNTKKNLSDLEQKEQEAQESTKNLGSESSNAQKHINGLSDDAKDAEKNVHNLGDKATDTKDDIKGLGNQSLKSGDIMKESLKAEAIVSGLKLIGNAAKDVSSAVIGVGSDFEASMSQVAATMGMSAEDVRSGSGEFKKLESAAEEMGATTKYTSAEAAEALNYLALAGYDANKSVETLPKILTLAQAGGMDLATTSDLVTDAMGALQLETSNLDKFTDQLAKTSQKSNTNVQQLGEGLLVVAGTSVSTGQDIEKVNTALGILANNGIKGAEGGTKLRNILLSLTAPTDKASEKIEALGLKVTDSTGQIRDIDDILSDLNGTLETMSEGERTEVLNTIFNKVDLAGVSSLLESTNGAFGDLYDNIVNSTGAASDMADTMNDNLKGKTAEVQSALEAVGIAAYKKFQVPLSKAAEKSVDVLGDFKDEITDGALSNSLDDLGDGIEHFTDVGLTTVQKVLPPFTNGLTWFLNHSELIIGGLSGIAAAMITQKVVTTVTDVIDGYKKFKKIAEEASIAQATFNGVMNASPWGAIATVAGLAIGTVATLVASSNDATDEMSYLNDEQEEVVKKSQELNKEISDNAETRQKNIDDIEATWGGYKIMAEKLYDLNEVEELSVGQKAQMKSMIDELNSVMPDLNLQLDEETGHLKTQKDVVLDLINTNLELAKVKGAQEHLSAISKDIAEAEINVERIGEEFKSTQKDYSEAIDKSSDSLKKLKKYIIETGAETEESLSRYTPDEFVNIAKDLSSASEEEAKKIDELSESYYKNKDKADETELATKKLAEEYNSSKETLDGVQKEWNITTKYIENHSEKVSETAEKTEVATEKMKVTVGKYKGQTVEIFSTAAENIRELEIQYEEQYQKRSQELKDSLDVFKAFTLDSEVTADSLLKNMESNLTGISNWSDGLNKLAERGLDEGLIQKLRDAGPTSASEVAAMTKMTDEQLDKYNQDWRTYTSKIDGIVSEELSGARTTINNEVNKAISETKKKDKPASNAGKKVGKALGDGIKTGYNESNPTNKVRGDIETLIKDVHEDYQQRLYNGFYDVGNFINEGLAAGLNQNRHKSTYEMEVLSQSVLYTGKKEFGINSPSKKFEIIADYCIQGEANGFKKGAPMLLKEIDNINHSILDRAQNIELANTIEITSSAARSIYNDSPELYPQTKSRKNPSEENTSISRENSNMTFNVTFSGVTINSDQDLEQLADKLMKIMENKTRRREAVYA